MKQLLILVALILTVPACAQSNWTTKQPVNTAVSAKEKKEQEKKEKEAEKAAKAVREAHYCEAGVVPVDAEGNVVFTLEKDFPGISAAQIYNAVGDLLDNMAKEEDQLNSAGQLMVQEDEYRIVAQYDEWLRFTDKLLVSDKTEMAYYIMVDCTDGHLHMTIEHIIYTYEADRPTGFRLPAEKVITNKYALNKKGTKLMPHYGKFRRRTIDRVEEIFKNAASLKF